ncbi:TIP41-like protein [Uloborus diversus]|uniref:TIP41-like protein n=1 Tax=Uloborus diversus TaxID=327109 RepID=UPI00240A069C|nr:TIP41-like protein [Uloborus diversus]
MDNLSANVGKRQTFRFRSWNVIVNKSHILPSRCLKAPHCVSDNESVDTRKCDFCKFEKELELPQVPEMTFANNVLRLEHDNGFAIEFNALDALKMVDSKNDSLKVAVAEAWAESRMESPHLKGVIKPFDWTYGTNYKGTLQNSDKIQVEPTEERIDIEKLKVKSEILFYEDVILFEDELADNGIAQFTVKIRVMPDSFFVLMRYFLRVDNLIIRIIDTRIYYEEGTNHLLREHMTKESKIKDLKVPIGLLGNPQELWSHMPIKQFEYEKLKIVS